MLRFLRRAGLALAALTLLATTTACNGNLDAVDNCSLVLAAAVEYDVIPDVGWAVYDASYIRWPDTHPFTYACRGITLAYGGVFVVYTILDDDAAYGGDDTYNVSSPVYETVYYDLSNHALMCKGQRVPLHLGEDCSDHGI